MPLLLCTSAARWGLRVGAGPTVSGAECNAVKSRRVRRCLPWGPAKGREFCDGLPRLSGRSHKRQESRNSRRLAGGVGFLFFGVGGIGFCGAEARTDRLPQPARETQPTPHQRLPPRETRTERRRTTRRPPPLHRQRNALEIKRSNPALPPLPTNADQEMPTPSGPTDLKMLSHTFFERAFSGR